MRKPAHNLPCRSVEHRQEGERSTINLCSVLFLAGPCEHSLFVMDGHISAGWKSLTGGCFIFPPHLGFSSPQVLGCPRASCRARVPFHGAKLWDQGLAQGFICEILCQPRAQHCPARGLFSLGENSLYKFPYSRSG